MRVRAALLVGMLLSACGSGSAPSGGGSTGAAPTATAAPTTSAAPAVTKRFTFEKDPVVDTKLVGTNDQYINPGALLEVDGVLHMFPNSFSKWPGRVRVPHLTSEDGRTWTLDGKAPLLDSEDVELADPGIDVSTGFRAEDGTWVLLFETVATSRPWVIARATAPSPSGPWSVEAKPILEPGPVGSFDNGGVQWPWVVRVGDRWAMYYTGAGAVELGTSSIGVAFSSDGTTWTKNADPVLVGSEPWEGRSVDRPRVAKTPDGYVMVYAGRDLTKRGLAISTDGITWTKLPGPSIERKDFPVRQPGSWDAGLLYRGSQLEYFLEIGGETTKIYRATLAWP